MKSTLLVPCRDQLQEEDMLMLCLCVFLSVQRQRKLEQAKIARDFQAAVTSFQRMQQRSAKQQKAFVEKAKAAANEEEQMPRAQTSA